MKGRIDKKQKIINKKLEIMMESRFKKIEISNNNYKIFGKFPSLQKFKKTSPIKQIGIRLKSQSKVKSDRFFSMNKNENTKSRGTFYDKLLLNIQAKKLEASLSLNKKNSDIIFNSPKVSLQPSTISLSKNQDLDKSIEKVLKKLKNQRIKNFQQKYKINRAIKVRTQAAEHNDQYEILKYNFNSIAPIQIMKSTNFLSSKKEKFYEINQKRKYIGSFFH